MFACLDVDYREGVAFSGRVCFSGWDSDTALHELVLKTTGVAEYEPGQFYRRELPCLLAVLAELETKPSLLLVDGFAWLGAGKRGLGAYLYEALGCQTPVVGVAKNPYRTAHEATEVLHGESKSPLYVTAAGMANADAAAGVERMHGPYRIPTMLKRVDRLCREAGD